MTDDNTLPASMQDSSVLVTGASGLLGANLVLALREAGAVVTGVSHCHALAIAGVPDRVCDLSRPLAVEDLMCSVRPRWIVNAAAITDVDWCEAHPDESRRVNTDLPRALAARARAGEMGLVHISTDSVFDGTRGDYDETDAPAPLNAYARSKLDAEDAVREAYPSALVVRTNFYGWNAQPKRSLGEWVLAKLEAGGTVPGFEDVIFSPLLVNDLVGLLQSMMAAGLTGLYHAGASETCTKLDFARRVAAAFGFEASAVRPSRIADAALRAVRPRNTSLNTARLAHALGRPLPSIADGIRRFRALRDAGFAERLKQSPIGVTHD